MADQADRAEDAAAVVCLPAGDPQLRDTPDTSACLPRIVSDLGHDQVVANGKSDGTGPLHRMSAWLPPGLALGWLAVLGTFVHGVAALVAAWVATVSLAVFLARRLIVSADDPREVDRNPAEAPHYEPSATLARIPPTASQPAITLSGRDKDTQDTADSPGLGGHASVRASHGSDPSFPPGSGPGATAPRPADQTKQSVTTEIATTLELRVLTAAEVASVLRVDTNVIVKAISTGELPGNRIGNQWRVDHGALMRWLQGKYGTTADSSGYPSPTEIRTDPG